MGVEPGFTVVAINSDPPPQPSPTRGEGAQRSVCSLYPHNSLLAIRAPFTIASNFAHTMLAWISSVPAMTFSRPHAALGF